MSTKSETPRTDAEVFEASERAREAWRRQMCVDASFARKLERSNAELVAALEEIAGAPYNNEEPHSSAIAQAALAKVKL